MKATITLNGFDKGYLKINDELYEIEQVKQDEDRDYIFTLERYAENKLIQRIKGNV